MSCVPPCRSRPRCVLISWLTWKSPIRRQMPGQLKGNENWCFGMSTKTASTAMSTTNQEVRRMCLSYSSGREKSAASALDVISIGETACTGGLIHGLFARGGEPLARFTHLAVEGRLIRVGGRGGPTRKGGGLRGRLRFCGLTFKDLLRREELVRLQKLLAELIRCLAKVSDHAADVSRHARQTLRPQNEERDDEHEHELLRADSQHQRCSTAAARAAFAASRSERAADAAAASKSAPLDAYVTERDAVGSTPPPRASRAARIAVAMSPP